jgi:UDP-N-acetyl-D-galactosamine dehydrogenase
MEFSLLSPDWLEVIDWWSLIISSKAQEMGYHPEIIWLEDAWMTVWEYVASQIVKLMRKGFQWMELRSDAWITFKENCPDVRNTKIVDVIAALTDYGITVTIYDPLASPEAVKKNTN